MTPPALPAKTNGKRNRAAGHKYETDIAKLLRSVGFAHVVTSRSENRSRDAQKVDLVNKDEYKNGRLLYNLQCKCEVKPVSYAKLLSEISKEKPYRNVVLHRQTARSTAGKFMVKDEFAIMYQADFMALIAELEAYRLQFLTANTRKA